MNDDLEQMFAALREADERFAPSFDEIATLSQVARLRPAKSDRPSLLSVRVALTAITCTIVFTVASWIHTLRKELPSVSSLRHADLQNLNLACDSLLVTYESLPPEMAPVAQGMEWPTETDSLVPFETLTFHLRNSP